MGKIWWLKEEWIILWGTRNLGVKCGLEAPTCKLGYLDFVMGRVLKFGALGYCGGACCLMDHFQSPNAKKSCSGVGFFFIIWVQNWDKIMEIRSHNNSTNEQLFRGIFNLLSYYRIRSSQEPMPIFLKL